MRKPTKWVLTILVPVAVLILIGSGLFNVAKWAIGSWTTKPPVSPQATEQPVVSPKPTAVAKSKSGCTDLPVRMAQAKVTGVQVNNVFYQAHPDRVGKPLTEADLKQEWCSIADRLIAQKSAK